MYYDQVNLGGYYFLTEKDMLLDRMSGVTYDSLTAAFHSTFEEFRDCILWTFMPKIAPF